MQRGRPYHPGMLRLGKESVLVVGGASIRRTAELLQRPRNDGELGLWTLLNATVTQEFVITFLANFNGRT